MARIVQIATAASVSPASSTRSSEIRQIHTLRKRKKSKETVVTLDLTQTAQIGSACNWISHRSTVYRKAAKRLKGGMGIATGIAGGVSTGGGTDCECAYVACCARICSKKRLCCSASHRI